VLGGSDGRGPAGAATGPGPVLRPVHSINPVFAALTGLVVLGQSLALADWLVIAAIVTANAISVSVSSGQRRVTDNG
jgi:threonine/homoserine efflux transporter RhtA